MIDRLEIDRVKQATNIKDVIGSDVVWTKTARSYGGTLKGACPWCQGVDRFHCHPADGNWWCRQCGRRGDVFCYWMQRYNVSFAEAYQALALAVGLSVDEVTPDPELIYLLTLYIAPWQGTPDLPADRLTTQANGWLVAVFETSEELDRELARLGHSLVNECE